MPDIARGLKDEITRLAKKEVRTGVRPLTRQLRSLRKAVRGQNRQVLDLARVVSKAAKDQEKIAAELPQGEEGKATRISPASIKRHRERLRLSQREMGLLLGVSVGSIVGWESGRSAPREKNRQAFAQLRGMGVRDVRERLEKTA